MMTSYELRSVLLKTQDCLSDDDRKRLHFFFCHDVPRRLQDDLTVNGTLSLLETLFTQNKINEQDLTLLIAAFENIKCFDAVKLLKDYMAKLQEPQATDTLMPFLAEHSDKRVKTNHLISLNKYGNNNIQINHTTTNINPSTVNVQQYLKSRLSKQTTQFLLTFSFLLNIGLVVAMVLCVIKMYHDRKELVNAQYWAIKSAHNVQQKILDSADERNCAVWVNARDGEVPVDAIIGGQEGDRHVYIVRIQVGENNVIPGKLVDKNKRAETEYNGVWLSATYQVLTNPVPKLRYEWIQTDSHNLSLCVVPSGKEKQTNFYIARTVRSPTMVLLGKYDVRNKRLYYLDDGVVKSTDKDIEVLCIL
ncbi:unnamed protein product [Adineta ricciae]|uniref:DED domain-containing protein n=1 Tax=Adineta ricciae TaxID=249248 RepID=A0A814R2B4_ADIRI|nr:unnamed protein product [Adineta ricciae]CAF1478878.1 unnamed protein product [Adineta ricciae]